MKYKISKRGLILTISALLILVSISSFTSGIEETNKVSDIYKEPESNPTPKDYTHTVLAEVGTGSWCYWCQFTNAVMHDIYTNGNYDFEYVELVEDKVSAAHYRCVTEYNIGGYPTTFFDGGYQVQVGGASDWPSYTNKMDTCGARDVPDITATVNVNWLGNEQIEVDVAIQNNEASAYTGHIRAFIVEIVSPRWNDYAGADYNHAFLDYAFNQAISIPAGNTYTDNMVWDGSSWNSPDLTMSNIMVVLGVYNSEWHQGYAYPPNNPFDAYYVDETVATIATLQDTEPPTITNVQANPSIQTAGGYINISADVTDNTEVNEVKVNITYPDMSTISETMIEVGGDTYYYNTSYATSGTYDFNIWANDLENNQAESPHDTFVIVNPHITNLSQGWNFVSLPFNQSIDLVDLTVNYGGTDYTWTAATGMPIVDPNVYGWDRVNDIYVPATTMEPGYGYWIYAYFDCELLGQDISVIPDTYITDLKMGWNAMGVPSDQPVGLVDLTVNYGGTDYTWTAATGMPIVDPNVYGWDRVNDIYVPATTLEPGYAYWIYAYQDCRLFL